MMACRKEMKGREKAINREEPKKKETRNERKGNGRNSGSECEEV